MKTTLNEMLFPVEKALISERIGVNSISSTEYGIFAYVDGDTTPTLLNTCSNTYELLPNSQLFPVIEKTLLDAKIEFEVNYKMIDFSRFYADYTLKTGAITVGGRKDKLFPLLRIEHSYNGLLKYKMSFGYFRIYCKNGLVVPVEGKEAENIHIIGKHTSKIMESLKSLMEKVTFFTKNQKKFSEKFEIVADRWVKDWSSRVEEVMNATGVGKRGLEEITSRINLESKEFYDGKVNDWLIYNAFNYHIFNAKTSKGKEYDTAPNLRIDQDRKVFNTLFENPDKIKVKKVKAEA